MTYQADFDLGPVALNVKDLRLQVLFYKEVLGMVVLEKTDGQAILGTEERPLVELYQTEDSSDVKGSYGLYHLALLLPSRQTLGDLFKHLIDNEVPLIGASDHGYSEAIYLEDTEGNGIEVYRDRPISDWDIREDGRIVGITEPMDAEGVYQAARPVTQGFQLAKETVMGHVHLSVRYSQASSAFYQRTLGLSSKFSVATGAWLASGNYHHHLAVNEWSGHALREREKGMLGLAHYTLIYRDEKVYQERIEAIKALGNRLEILDETSYLSDLDGIKTKLILESKNAL